MNQLNYVGILQISVLLYKLKLIPILNGYIYPRCKGLLKTDILCPQAKTRGKWFLVASRQKKFSRPLAPLCWQVFSCL